MERCARNLMKTNLEIQMKELNEGQTKIGTQLKLILQIFSLRESLKNSRPRGFSLSAVGIKLSTLLISYNRTKIWQNKEKDKIKKSSNRKIETWKY